MCARACLNFKAFVSGAKAAKPPVKTWLVPSEPLFPLRRTTAADKGGEGQERSASRAQHPASDWSPSTSAHVRGQSYKDLSSQPQVFYRMTSFITLLVTGNDVYLIYHSFRIFFFCHIWLYAAFLMAQFLSALKGRRNGTAATMPAPQSYRQPCMQSPRGDFPSKPGARVRWRVDLRLSVLISLLCCIL